MIAAGAHRHLINPARRHLTTKSHAGRQKRRFSSATAATTAENVKMMDDPFLGAKIVGGGWIFFVLENLVLSENKDFIVDKGGVKLYGNLYSLCSTVATGCMVLGFFKYGRKGYKFNTTFPKTGAALLGVGVVSASQMLPFSLQNPFASFFGAGDGATDTTSSSSSSCSASSCSSSCTATPSSTSCSSKTSTEETLANNKKRTVSCPFDFTGDKKLAAANEDGVFGMKRVTRHPAFWSMSLLGMGLALRTPYLSNISFYVGPLLCTTILCTHMDVRKRREGDMTADWPQTSHVPFAAMALGEQNFSKFLEEAKLTNAVAAAGLCALVLMRRGRGGAKLAREALPK